jgi:hypothetical protein
VGQLLRIKQTQNEGDIPIRMIPGPGINAMMKSKRITDHLIPVSRLTVFFRIDLWIILSNPSTPVLDSSARNQYSLIPINLSGPLIFFLSFSFLHVRVSKASSTANAKVMSPALANNVKNQLPVGALTLPRTVRRVEAVEAT